MSKRKTTERKQVLIIDDHPMMRQGLAQLLECEPDLCACGQAGTAGEALAALAGRRPDLVLADISLPDRNGLELIKDLQALHPGLPILVVSMHDEALYAERVLRAGGRGYIMKQEGGKKLLDAIRQILSGRVYLSEKMSARVLESLSGRGGAAAQSPLDLLSDREFEVFQHIGQGKATREIARLLRLSVKTVEVHRINIKKKLGLQTATELVRHAVRFLETQSPS